MHFSGLFYDLFILEIGLFAVLFCLIIVSRLYRSVSRYFLEKEKAFITKLFKKAIEEPESIIAQHLQLSVALIEVMEEFDQRFKGGPWETIEQRLAESSLLNGAKKWVGSVFWQKRNLAARTYALLPRSADEPYIMTLIDDAHFLVYSYAAKAAVALCSPEGIRKIVQRMAKVRGYPYFALRDILLQGTKEAYAILINLGKESELHKTVLDCLSTRSVTLPIPYLEKDLDSPDNTFKLLALKILQHNPLKNSANYFNKALEDSDPLIRLEAAKGLSLFPHENSLARLTALLQDPVWQVRVEAGKTLKKSGSVGVAILEQQTDKTAQETASYVLQFG